MSSNSRPTMSAGTQHRQAFKTDLDATRAQWLTLINQRWLAAKIPCDRQYNLQSEVLTKADDNALIKEIDELKLALDKLRDCVTDLRLRAYDWKNSVEEGLSIGPGMEHV
ncbi:hypothetical protein EK21DRAFT_119062 [Setomelanomma holmii]|uniref:Uncharacterized protein n=1 Tax=Setomelanomma holmii TaxID=210430 RepID=A0A9P4LFF7_9PLEO|nr:hypothetical protein EK21DRAFT_119062 [Setomelanomma holmii]